MAKPRAIRPGYHVAISLVPKTAPNNCYIGLVQDADEFGVRINLVHWEDELDVIGGYTEGLFLPWASITSILVCTEEQPTRRFVRDKAPEWQAKMESTLAGKTVTRATKTPRRP